MIFNQAVVSACLASLVAGAAASATPDDEKYFSLHAKREYTGNRLSKRANSLDTDVDFLKLGFYLDVEVGSNKDKLKVLVDTGSSDFWIATSDVCSSDDDDDDDDDDDSSETTYDCDKYGSFNVKKSKTFKSNNTDFFLSYGDSSEAIGVFGQDDVIVENTTIKGVNLAVANFTNSSSGVLGIGYEATESTYFEVGLPHPYKYVNFPEKLVADGIINKAAYSLFLDEKGDAEILFGAVDHSKYTGSLYQFPMVPMNASGSEISRTAITLNSIALNNGKLEAFAIQGYVPAVLDSGTTFVALPVEVGSTIAELLGLSLSQELGQFYGDCDAVEGVNFVFNFQGVEFLSPVSSYFSNIVDSEGSEGCLFQAFLTNEEYIILGDAFLRDIYTVIDLDDNVAALAYRSNSSSSNVDVISKSIPSASKPPSSKTFGGKNSVYTYYDKKLTTTAFKSSKATPSLDTDFQTITLSAENSDDGDYSDDYSDYYSDYYSDEDNDYTSEASISYTRGKHTAALTDFIKAATNGTTASPGSSVVSSIVTATVHSNGSSSATSSSSHNGAAGAATYSTGFALFALLATLLF